MTRQYLIIEDGDLVVNKKDCYLIPEFKLLFDRDKGCKQDLTGKHKLLACSEMKYIYYHKDPRSEYFNAPLSMCSQILKELSGVPDNWKEDKDFLKAVDKYKELQLLSAAGSAYFSADAALFDLGVDTRFTSEAIRDLKSYIQTNIKLFSKASKEYTLEEEERLIKLANQLNNIMKLQNDNIAIINKMPGLTKTLKLLKEQYSEEDNGEQVLVGGRSKGNRED